jgi:hypothetical protein
MRPFIAIRVAAFVAILGQPANNKYLSDEEENECEAKQSRTLQRNHSVEDLIAVWQGADLLATETKTSAFFLQKTC